MTDLCYNCLSCHLPAPCKQDLVQCEICYTWGHQLLFCPRGVHLRLPDYNFFALCQNCDAWHLPKPCTEVFHVCAKCTNPGHLEHFCPINASVHPKAQSTEGAAQQSAPPPTRHFTEDKLGLMAHSQLCLQIPQQVAQVTKVSRTDTITRIKLDAVNQAFGMLAQGYLPFQIIDFMSGPYLPRQIPNPALSNAVIAAIGKRHLTASSELPRHTLPPAVQAGSFVQPSIENPSEPEQRVRADSSAWRKIEPKPSGPRVLEYEDVPGTYTLMQQRFDQGDLAKTVEQDYSRYVQGALHASQTTHGATSSMGDATLQASRRISQPTTHLLLQQATSRMGSVASNAQDSALASLAKQAMSQPQRGGRNMQDTASMLQNHMTMDTSASADNTENLDDTGNVKVLKIGKKKLKLSTRAEKETTPGGTINQGPRCAKCIKGHKRCTHRIQESLASDLPLGSSPLDIPSTPSDYISTAGVPGGSTPAPTAMPDNSLAPPATSVEVPVQAAKKKAAAKRKR